MGHRLGEIHIFEPLNGLRGQSCQVASRNKDFPGLDLLGYSKVLAIIYVHIYMRCFYGTVD